jgi:hypothetical protein
MAFCETKLTKKMKITKTDQKPELACAKTQTGRRAPISCAALRILPSAPARVINFLNHHPIVPATRHYSCDLKTASEMQNSTLRPRRNSTFWHTKTGL